MFGPFSWIGPYILSFFYVFNLFKGYVPKIEFKSFNQSIIDGFIHSVIESLII